MTYPRLFAVAENGWTSESQQNFDDFINRLQPQLERLEHKNVRYAKSVFNPKIYQKGKGSSIEVTLEAEFSNPDVRYTLDGSTPTAKSTPYTGPFTLTETKTIKAAIFQAGEQLGDIIEASFPIHKAAGAQVTYNLPFSKKDEAAKEQALTDLNYGFFDKPDNWQGFSNNLDVTLTLKEAIDIEEITVTSRRYTIIGQYPPVRFEILGSSDGKTFKTIGSLDNAEVATTQGRNIIKTKIPCPAKGIKEIRVKADILNLIPEGHHRAWAKSYLKIDEIVVN